MSNSFGVGNYVLYKGRFACVHGATKGKRLLIEVQSPDNDREVFREWVLPASITPLDPTISDLLRCIYDV